VTATRGAESPCEPRIRAPLGDVPGRRPKAIAAPSVTHMGRPSKLTPEVRDKIVTAIRAGNFISTAAAYAGVSESAVFAWLAEGRQEDAPADKAEFLAAVTRARAATEVQLVGHVLRDVAGGYVTTRRTRTLRDGSVEVEEVRTGPNGTLGLKVLMAAFPG
jgi:hypothetical protein